MAGQATFQDLPDEVLGHVFSKLKWPCMPAAACVCRRWRAVVRSGPLCLHSIGARMGGGSDHRALHVLAWFAAYASAHLRRLSLTMVRPVSADRARALVAAAQGLLAGCSRLTDLDLIFQGSHERNRQQWGPLELGGWVGALSRLRILSVTGEARVTLAAPLAALTALRSCTLAVRQVEMLAGGRLPASLTQLELAGCAGDILPWQLALLPALCNLVLRHAAPSSTGYAPLTALGTLGHLEMHDCLLPSCLSALTQLTSLVLERTRVQAGPAEVAHTVQAALLPLRQLRRLHLHDIRHLANLPPAVVALPLLADLTWHAQQ